VKKIKVGDAEIAYRDVGSGNPIVFLHAFPLNQTMWDEQVNEFSSEYRTITFDWRGFGESSPGQTDISISVFADDLAALLDHLEIDKANVCGLSMGGYAAFYFYRKYADRIKSLILCDTRAAADTEDGKRGRYEMAELVRSEGPFVMVEKMTPKLLSETSLQENQPVVLLVENMIKSAKPEAIAQALIGMAHREDSSDLLPQINCPTLIIVGAEDTLTPPTEAEKMNKSIPKSKLEKIPNAGHLANLEQPAIFNQIISSFLRQL